MLVLFPGTLLCSGVCVWGGVNTFVGMDLTTTMELLNSPLHPTVGLG